jgi:hypothetical protein
VNEVALRDLGIPPSEAAQRFNVDVPAGRVSLVYVPTTSLRDWASTADDAAPQLLARGTTASPIGWRAAATPVDDEEVEIGEDDAVEDVPLARSGTVEEPMRVTLRPELSPWDVAALDQSLDASERPTLVVPTTNLTPAGVSAPVRERRFLHAVCPTTVAVGSEFTVTCAIRLSAGASAVITALDAFEVPYDGATAFIAIFVDDGLEVISNGWVPQVLFPGVDSEEIEFRVRVTSSVPRSTRVSFVVQVDGRCVGNASTRVKIGAATTPPTPLPPLPLLPRLLEEGDVLIAIVHEYIGGEHRLRFNWQDGRVRALPDLVVLVDAARTAVLSRARKELWRLTQQRPRASAEETRQRLRMLGRELWALLLPLQIQTLLTTQRDLVKRILLLTDDTAIPWELLHPPNDDRSPEFLVESVPLTRWPMGTQMFSSLRAEVARIAVPVNAPAAATAEGQLIRDIIARKGQSDAITDFGLLMAAVEAGEFNILHFACHDLYEAGQMNFGGVLFGVNLLHSATLARNPLVFVNAGRTTPVSEDALVISQKWARSVIEKRAAAFVGAQWCVAPEAATEFARAFYEPIVEQASLGEAVLSARRAIRDRPGDPTWLAYAVYGDPLARVP